MGNQNGIIDESNDSFSFKRCACSSEDVVSDIACEEDGRNKKSSPHAQFVCSCPTAFDKYKPYKQKSSCEGVKRGVYLWEREGF